MNLRITNHAFRSARLTFAWLDRATVELLGLVDPADVLLLPSRHDLQVSACYVAWGVVWFLRAHSGHPTGNARIPGGSQLLQVIQTMILPRALYLRR